MAERKTDKLLQISSSYFMLVLQLRNTNQIENLDLTMLRTKAQDLLSKIERHAQIQGNHPENIQKAKFALVAFLDEAINLSGWSHKNDWLSQPLQLLMFNSYNAGEEFFDYLDKLRTNIRENREIIEIYYLCLILGFKGKYLIHDPEHLRKRIDQIYQELYSASNKSMGLLSPNGEPKEELVEVVNQGIPSWVISVICFSIAIVFYVVFSIFFALIIVAISSLIVKFAKKITELG